jgi:hypothetical protein
MSKFLLNLLVQISKALVYSKNQILFGKEFSPLLSTHPAFRPSLLFFTDRFSLPFPQGFGLSAGPAHPLGPTGQLSYFSRTEAGRARRRLAPPPRSPRRLHRKRKMAASNPPSFPHINRRHSLPLQSQKSVPSTPPLKLLQAGN